MGARRMYEYIYQQLVPRKVLFVCKQLQRSQRSGACVTATTYTALTAYSGWLPKALHAISTEKNGTRCIRQAQATATSASTLSTTTMPKQFQSQVHRPKLNAVNHAPGGSSDTATMTLPGVCHLGRRWRTSSSPKVLPKLLRHVRR